MPKPKTSLKEPQIDNRLLDDRGPTGERLARLGNHFTVSDTGVLNLRVSQSPIERAVARGTISEQHGRAAAKFYHHWRRSGCASLASNWKSEPSPISDNPHIPMARTELEAFDRRTIRRAIDAIHEAMDRCGQSIVATKMLFMVVCDEISIEDAALALWPKWGVSKRGAVGLDRLRSALRVLSIEWGL